MVKTPVDVVPGLVALICGPSASGLVVYGPSALLPEPTHEKMNVSDARFSADERIP